uniref:small monomeric GTPase n=1 Tax=Sander lucioperca TaxID=283035 RepID=A0A8C9ZS66_SANLU
VNDAMIHLVVSFGLFPPAVLVRFLTRRFIGEYASNANSLYHKRLSIDGRQLNLEVFDPCSQVQHITNTPNIEPVDWADGFVVVYNISDCTSFINAKNILRQIRETRLKNCKGSEVPVCLVGNKQDLCHARQVREDEGRCLAQENRCHFQEVSAAESYQDIANLFTQLIRQVMEHLKYRADRRRYSGSKSMAKLINNVFGKRRKSV